TGPLAAENVGRYWSGGPALSPISRPESARGSSRCVGGLLNLVLGCQLCPLFSSLRQAPIVVCNSKHSFLCRFIIYFVSEKAHLLRTLEPMLGVVYERSEHHIASLGEWSSASSG